MFFGLVVIAVGLIALLVNLGVLPGSIWSYTWPVILIIFGLSCLMRRRFGYRSGWSSWCCPTKKDRDD
ncbi:LiaI-LiaF-like domain-containing protein [Chloroflexota bacterium]